MSDISRIAAQQHALGGDGQELAEAYYEQQELAMQRRQHVKWIDLRLKSEMRRANEWRFFAIVCLVTVALTAGISTYSAIN